MSHEVVQVRSELIGVDRRRAGKGGKDGGSINEAASSQRRQLAGSDILTHLPAPP